MVFLKRASRGVSLVEMLIVATIIVILITLLVFGYLGQLKKGRDSERKADLAEIKRAMEDYFNDKGCYPTQAEIENYFRQCGSAAFSPWLRTVPCDPLYHSPYLIKVENTTCPGWFAIYVDLEYLNDPQLATNECSNYRCLVNKKIYNFGVSSENIMAGNVDDDQGTLQGGMSCGVAKAVLAPPGPQGERSCNVLREVDKYKFCCCDPQRDCYIDVNCKVPCATEEFCKDYICPE